MAKPSPIVNNAALTAALELTAAGLSVIPILKDGSKAPALERGHPVLNRRRRATDPEIHAWWGKGQHGVAVLAGAISGNAECIDFDDGALILPWLQLVIPEVERLSDRICMIETPSGGFHVWYRCSATVIPGSKKLARDPARPPDSQTLIETRGEGGYALVPGCPPECHTTGSLYRHKDGVPLTGLQDITAEERFTMLMYANAFDKAAKEDAPATPTHRDYSDAPGTDYNKRGPSFEQLLKEHGWKIDGTSGRVIYWQRPGKAKGKSATTGYCFASDGTELFHCFSSNAEPFEPGKSYSKFRCYALLCHGGDLSIAARELRRQGYGKNAPTPAASMPDLSPAAARAAAQVQPPKPKIAPPGPDDCFTGAELMKMVLPPVRWAVPGLIPEGGAVLAGRPKSGKSWLILHTALAVATGGTVLGQHVVERGPVLYLALEDTKRRLQRRIHQLGYDNADLAMLHLRTRWPPLNDGGLDLLAAEVARLHPRLIVVDTIGKVRAHRVREDNAYAADYSFAGEMKRVADDHHSCLVAIHHTSKTPRADPVDEISGTLGLSGAFDTILVLKRDRQTNDATLFLTGRDVDEQEVSLTIDVTNQVWQSHGSAASYQMSQQRKDVIDLLTRFPAGLRPRDMADMLGKPQGAVRGLLFKMSDDQQVTVQDGRYVLAQTVNGVNGVNDRGAA